MLWLKKDFASKALEDKGRQPVEAILGGRVTSQSLVDAITERLENAIVSGELAPGQKIRELVLARTLGVSRGPLREAIRRLEGRKLVHRTPNIGVHVAAFDYADLQELLYVREVLEGAACGLAAERMSDAELDALGKLLDSHRRQEAFKAGAGYYQEAEDFDFHFRVVKASENARLIDMLCGDLYHLLRVFRYKSSTGPGRATQAMEEHLAILAALRLRDPLLAEQRMREHIRNARLRAAAQRTPEPSVSTGVVPR